MPRSVLRKAEIGQYAAEHGRLATVLYYATKLPFPFNKTLKPAICEMLDLKNTSALQYFSRKSGSVETVKPVYKYM